MTHNKTLTYRPESRCIATSADANYFPALMALLRSIRRVDEDLKVIVFDGGLTLRQKKLVQRSAEIIPKRPVVRIKGTGKFSYIGNTTLLKLETSELDIEKVLYLDADMLVMENLDPLFDFPEGRVGVVKEVNSVKNMFRMRHRKYMMDNIDIQWEGRGFNAGLFALRPSEWRDLKEKAVSLISDFGEDIFSKSKDQQLLNIIFNGKTHEFPSRYNFSPFYDDKRAEQPAIIHYLSEVKPWHMPYEQGHYYDEFRDNIRIFEFPEIFFVDLFRKIRAVKRKAINTFYSVIDEPRDARTI